MYYFSEKIKLNIDFFYFLPQLEFKIPIWDSNMLLRILFLALTWLPDSLFFYMYYGHVLEVVWNWLHT